MSLILGILAQSAGAASVPGTFESIATVSVGSGGSATVSFTSIPSTYEHLQLRILARTNFSSGTAGDYILARFNSDSGANYASHILNGNGSTVSSFGVTSQNEIWLQRYAGSDAGSNIFGVSVTDILDYKNTNKNKVTRNLGGWDQNGAGRVDFDSGLWLNTSAITSITLLPGTANFQQYSQFALYGIKGA
jgi:hypothetical protein